MIATDQIAIRLLAAAALGAVVGFERERRNQPAGLRTHIILAIGAALAMIISVEVPALFHNQTGAGDPGHIAAQVVSGIGFLGAGAILRYGTNVRGLTTAASVWTVAIIGLATGAGLYLTAAGATALLLLSLTLLNLVERHFIHPEIEWSVTFQAEDGPETVAQFRQVLHDQCRKVRSLGYSKNAADNLLVIEAAVSTPETENIHQLVEKLSTLPGVKQVRVHA